MNRAKYNHSILNHKLIFFFETHQSIFVIIFVLFYFIIIIFCTACIIVVNVLCSKLSYIKTHRLKIFIIKRISI